MSFCLTCGKTPENLPRCSGCRTARYCNVACQTLSWPLHRAGCKAIKMRREDNMKWTRGELDRWLALCLEQQPTVALQDECVIFVCHKRSNMAVRLRTESTLTPIREGPQRIFVLSTSYATELFRGVCVSHSNTSFEELLKGQDNNWILTQFFEDNLYLVHALTIGQALTQQ